ncbi:MAG: polysaccharide pyruvyl transferase family protein [Nitrososphaerota archaeon]|nr:polysaccharide pyruvyl transferase family protein [Nitrososphaerota archaeon]
MQVKKSLKILITGTNTTFDNGESAMASMAVKAMKQVFPYAQLTIGSTQKELDIKRWKRMLPEESKAISIVGVSSASKLSRKFKAAAVIFSYIPEFLKTDVCIDISGDGFSDATQFSLSATLTHSFQLLGGVVFRKPVVICAQSIGPFNTFLSRFIARFVINNVDLVTIREEISAEYLKKLGVSKPVMAVSSDFAFLLPPVSPPEAHELLAKEKIYPLDHDIVGLVPSDIISKWAAPDISDLTDKYNFYIKTMAQIVDYLIECYNVVVILMPQCFSKYARHDDGLAMRRVYQKVKHKNNVFMINGDYVPAEIRGIISQCSMIVTAKMHAAIAAVSTYVPVVVMAYSFKTRGIFGKKLNLDNSILDVRDYASNDFLPALKQKIDFVWTNRVAISSNLKRCIPIEKQKALSNAKLVADLLKNK